MVAAREQVRVARRLRELPAIRDAFAAGALSYSKVRALTRVAHPAIDQRLVELAQYSTAAQLERYCAGLRRGQDQHRADAGLLETEDRAVARRSLRWHRDADTGDLVVRARIPAGADTEAFLTQLRDAIVSEPDGDEPLEDLDCRRLDALLDLVAAGARTDASLAAQPETVIHVDAQPDNPGGSDDSAESPARSAATGGVDSSLRPWPFRLSSGAPLSSMLAAELGCDAGIRTVTDHTTGQPTCGERGCGERLDLGRHRRFPTRQLRRAIMRRDDRCCRFPGCTRRHRLNVHHIIHWEHGGPTDRANLLLLCPNHHRSIHRGGWTIHGDAATATFTRPDGRTAEPVPSPPGGTLAELIDANHRHGRDIALDGAGSNWLGDHIDWDCFFAAFNEGPSAPPLDWSPN